MDTKLHASLVFRSIGTHPRVHDRMHVGQKYIRWLKMMGARPPSFCGIVCILERPIKVPTRAISPPPGNWPSRISTLVIYINKYKI